jgi:hypothetical protein
MPGWFDRLRARFTRSKGPAGRRETFAGLRAIPLGLDPLSIETPDHAPWRGAAVAMMEIGLETGVASFVAIADGTVSMYSSAGGGVIGAGSHAVVREVATRFRTEANESRGLLQRTAEFPLPLPGEVRFQARTADGDFTGVAPEEALRSGRHPLSSLYAAGQDLITEIRLSTPDGGTH